MQTGPERTSHLFLFMYEWVTITNVHEYHAPWANLMNATQLKYDKYVTLYVHLLCQNSFMLLSMNQWKMSHLCALRIPLFPNQMIRSTKPHTFLLCYITSCIILSITGVCSSLLWLACHEVRKVYQPLGMLLLHCIEPILTIWSHISGQPLMRYCYDSSFYISTIQSLI